LSNDKKVVTKIRQEQATISRMLRIYCRAQHRTTADLCPQCQELESYAHARLERCLFMPEKPTCANCPVHCYQEPFRQKMREVMRFAGPKLIFQDPIAAMRHLAAMLKKDSARVRKAREISRKRKA